MPGEEVKDGDGRADGEVTKLPTARLILKVYEGIHRAAGVVGGWRGPC